MAKGATFTGNSWVAGAALFADLCDDARRATLLRALITQGKPTPFASRASTTYTPQGNGPDDYEQTAWLISERAQAEAALRCDADPKGTPQYSNAPFGALGRSNFMLGMDTTQGSGDHARQRHFAIRCLKLDPEEIHGLCTISLRAAAVLPLKKREFDAVSLAEQAALRFVAFWFGFAQSDLPLLEACTRKATHALSYQTFARHFATDPFALPENTAAMGALTRRTAELIDLLVHQHTAQQRDEFKAIHRELDELKAFEPDSVFEPWPAPPPCHPSNPTGAPSAPARPLAGFTPVMHLLAGRDLAVGGNNPYGGTDLAAIVTGLIAGTVGNVVGAVCLALQCFFEEPAHLKAAQDAAAQDWLKHGHRAGEDAELTPYIWEALRLNPPVAYLPRRTTRLLVVGGIEIPADSELVIAVGAATRDQPANTLPDTFNAARWTGCVPYDPLIFGGEPNNPITGRPSSFLHQCLGQHVAMPLVTHIVRQVLMLPGLAETINPRDSQPFGLTRQWGYHCLSYPLTYHRFELLRHSPLLLMMDLKAPTQQHADALRSLLHQQQPELTQALQRSGHVHFASFLLLENDTRLALLAFIDQDINDHLPHLAGNLGPVLAPLLPHIRDAPPLPVQQHPWEFAEALRRFNVAPVGDYVFSAYPNASLAMIKHQFAHAPARVGAAQHPLLVSMPVKPPTAVHAEQLKRVIQVGAPRIEKMLRESKHVHFACFVLLENDSQLMLLTVFDRGFDPYVEHFALQVGSLFDRLFEHMVHAPPMPVDEFPQDFVNLIRRFNQTPEANFFFSAQPNAEAAQIQRAFTRKAPL
jgi:cytochrome P450